ncbi:tyrosine-type recombinase/integrase [Dehalococcoidia bacterium]|nr:tyrosine-type recombinase/integrase [Dehalococcoidia bacterium]
MGVPEIEAFLTHLAVGQNVTASTQNQALSALLFLYRQVLKQALEGPIDAARAKQPERLPTILTKEEVGKVIGHLSGTHRLMAGLLYGSGLRFMECVRLRVKDMDYAQSLIVVRDGKGMKDRMTMLADRVIAPLQEHLIEQNMLLSSSGRFAPSGWPICSETPADLVRNIHLPHILNKTMIMGVTMIKVQFHALSAVNNL